MKPAAYPIVASMPGAVTRTAIVRTAIVRTAIVRTAIVRTAIVRTAIMANWVTSTHACKRGHKCPDGIARGSA
jgi:hypothetical protein